MQKCVASLLSDLLGWLGWLGLLRSLGWLSFLGLLGLLERVIGLLALFERGWDHGVENGRCSESSADIFFQQY